MNISVFGLGYVGVVTAACLANDGHTVIGVDISTEKVDLVNQGRSPVLEDGIDELVKTSVMSGKLLATLDIADAVDRSDIGIICVGTPSMPGTGSLDVGYIERVTRQIGIQLRERANPFTFVLRSTVLPGTVRSVVIPLLESTSGREIGNGYTVVFHPEFLREGTSIKDYYNPPKIVVGEYSRGDAKEVLNLYVQIESPRFVTSLEVAEMVKYADNVFHAVKITFANEIGQFCYEHNIDSRQVMHIFSQDKKLNISPRYLRPGFAFGGSCLPKDLRAFLASSREHHLSLPMLENILPSNFRQIERVLTIVLETRVSRIGLHGIAFKPGTDDLRESPLVELAERLIGKGKEIVIYDEKVQLSRLVGGNRSFIEERLPHLSRFLTMELEDLSSCDIILLGHPASDAKVMQWKQSGVRLLDLTGTADEIDSIV
jgi:GDP-mannose 6-dehydrogenase